MVLTSRFEEALVFATQLHAEQWRKGTHIPYIAHLLAVASIVLKMVVVKTRPSRACCMMPLKTRAVL